MIAARRSTIAARKSTIARHKSVAPVRRAKSMLPPAEKGPGKADDERTIVEGRDRASVVSHSFSESSVTLAGDHDEHGEDEGGEDELTEEEEHEEHEYDMHAHDEHLNNVVMLALV